MTNKVANLQQAIYDAKLSTNTNANAMRIAYSLMGSQTFERDVYLSGRAGYSVYVSKDSDDYICDLNDRIECNFADGYTKYIWVE